MLVKKAGARLERLIALYRHAARERLAFSDCRRGLPLATCLGAEAVAFRLIAAPVLFDARQKPTCLYELRVARWT